jgi:hypothetical protein
MPTRRAFLLTGGAFAMGVGLGGACGYAAGVQRGQGDQVERPAPDEPLAPSGDADLDELRRLAVKAPIEELVEHRLTFVYTATTTYRSDKVLWRGIERLCDAALSSREIPNKRIFAKALAQVIELGEPELNQMLKDRVPGLRGIK